MDEFRRHGHALVEWVAEYLSNPERYPVFPRVAPGDVSGRLPPHPPERGEPLDAIVADFERLLVPALTHWNHPGFFGYFATSASEAAVLAELLAAAVNQQAMLWRTSPAATELEAVALGWLRSLLGLPDTFDGVIYDTASISTLHALAAARERAMPGVRESGLAGRRGSRRAAIYCSEQAHSSIDKAAITLGLGLSSLRRIPVDAGFRLRPDRLRAALDADRRGGVTPVAIVATAGTTATTSVDPLADIAVIAREQQVWLHVDAAYAGAAAILPDQRAVFDGWEQADSIVINPHKWLFVPVDLSAFYCRRMDLVRRTFSVVPEFLRTPEVGPPGNLMDTGIQLGRRFRSLKLWMVFRHLGAEGLRAVLSEHLRLARLFAGWVDADPDFERAAPVPFSVVCFRARPRSVPPDDPRLDALNERLLAAVNASGEALLSDTVLAGRRTLRLAIGHLRTKERHVARAWEILKAEAARLAVAS